MNSEDTVARCLGNHARNLIGKLLLLGLSAVRKNPILYVY